MKPIFLNKRIASILAAAALTTSLATSTAFAAGEKIVASFHNLAEPFFVFMNKEVRDEAKKLDINVSVVDGQSNSPKQTADVENAITQGVAGIILAPTDAKALAPAVDDAIGAGIPVVTVDRRVEGTSKPVPHVGADNVAGGRKMAEQVVKQFPNGASIVFLLGQPGSSSAIDRAKGVHDAIAAAGPKYKIVAEQTANWARDQGLTVTQNILTSLTSTPPNAIIASNDDMALGAIEAVASAGLQKNGIAIVGFDATPDALKKVKDGEMLATVEQDPGRQIRTALRTLVDNIRNKKPIESVAVEPVVITSANLDAAARFSELK
jgi:inositol transport system substrate-binding protein